MLDEQIRNEVSRLSSNVPTEASRPRPKKINGLVENYQEPIGKRVIKALFENDLKTVGTELIYEVMIPKAKDIVADLFISGIEKAIYGDDAGSSRSHYSGYSGYSSQAPTRRASYDAYYDQRNGRYYTPESTVSRRPKVRWDRIVMVSRPKAIELLDSLRADIRRYNYVTVLDLYDYVTDVDEELGTQIDSEFTDNNIGWYNLDRVPIEAVQGGYWLKLPKPVRVN